MPLPRLPPPPPSPRSPKRSFLQAAVEVHLQAIQHPLHRACASRPVSWFRHLEGSTYMGFLKILGSHGGGLCTWGSWEGQMSGTLCPLQHELLFAANANDYMTFRQEKENNDNNRKTNIRTVKKKSKASSFPSRISCCPQLIHGWFGLHAPYQSARFNNPCPFSGNTKGLSRRADQLWVGGWL